MSIGNMKFSPNKTPTEIRKEGAFDGTYFRVIYSGINKKWHRIGKNLFC